MEDENEALRRQIKILTELIDNEKTRKRMISKTHFVAKQPSKMVHFSKKDLVMNFKLNEHTDTQSPKELFCFKKTGTEPRKDDKIFTSNGNNFSAKICQSKSIPEVSYCVVKPSSSLALKDSLKDLSEKPYEEHRRWLTEGKTNTNSRKMLSEELLKTETKIKELKALQASMLQKSSVKQRMDETKKTDSLVEVSTVGKKHSDKELTGNSPLKRSLCSYGSEISVAKGNLSTSVEKEIFAERALIKNEKLRKYEVGSNQAKKESANISISKGPNSVSQQSLDKGLKCPCISPYKIDKRQSLKVKTRHQSLSKSNNKFNKMLMHSDRFSNKRQAKVVSRYRIRKTSKNRCVSGFNDKNSRTLLKSFPLVKGVQKVSPKYLLSQAAAKSLTKAVLISKYKLRKGAVKSQNNTTPLGAVQESSVPLHLGSLRKCSSFSSPKQCLAAAYYKKMTWVRSKDYDTCGKKPLHGSKSFLDGQQNKRHMKLIRLPDRSKLKLDYRGIKKKRRLSADTSLVLINGMVYRSSKRKLTKAVKSHTQEKALKSPFVIKCLKSPAMRTITVRGVKFQVDPSGKSLHKVDVSDQKDLNTCLSKKERKTSNVSRIDIGGFTYVQTSPGTLEKVATRSRVLANRSLNRSIATAKAKNKNGVSKKAKQYCVFYNRFGKCNRGKECPFIHDPDKIAVCTRFLRGTCKVSNCIFSHKVAKEKMPTCSYFLRGICNRENCPYLHVNVNRNAKMCEDFLNGYCGLGEKCTKKHFLMCQMFRESGACSHKLCKFNQNKRQQPSVMTSKKDVKKKLSSDLKPVSTSTTICEKRNVKEDSLDSSFSCLVKPLNTISKQPSFISLGNSSLEPVDIPSVSFEFLPDESDHSSDLAKEFQKIH